jgi:hypothetical protein
VTVKRIATAVAGSILVVACSSASGPGPAASAVSAAQACADNAHQRCTQLQTCSATDLQLRYGTEGDCETRETSSCVMSLAEPLNGNTPTAVEACANAYAGWACDDYLNDVNVPVACRQQLGPVANGGGCAIDGQCVSGFCALAPGNACGRCTALPHVGASCAQLIGCGPGLACTTDTVECAAFAIRGEACGSGAPCGVGLSCEGGSCRDAADTMGAACDPTLQSGPGCELDLGLVCNSMSSTCQPVVIAATGQPCGDVGDQAAYCQVGSSCAGSSSTTPGTCTAAAADGAPCDLVAGPACLIPARCIGAGNGATSGTCQYSGAQSCPPQSP